MYLDAVYALHTFANAIMGTVFTGCAAFGVRTGARYAHERRAGECRSIRHQSVGLATVSTCPQGRGLRVR